VVLHSRGHCTGVYKEGSKPRFQPNAIVDNVLEAVKHGMQREMAKQVKGETASLRLNGEVNGEVIMDEEFNLGKSRQYDNSVVESYIVL